MLDAEFKSRLEQTAKLIRLDIVKLIGSKGIAGHIGGSLSCADIVTALYFYKMKYDAPGFVWDERDRFIMSKGHGAPAQYAALAASGIISKAAYDSFKRINGMLQGHPDHDKTPGIEANTGSLGQGLSVACGMAAAMRMDGDNHRVYVLLGDGEIAEGQVWEGAVCAANYKLDKITAILDMNRLGSTGVIADRYPTCENIAEKWAAFGWAVHEIDGHDMDAICGALDAAETEDRPTMIIAHTVKGKGLPFAENSTSYHNSAFTKEQYEDAVWRLSR